MIIETKRLILRPFRESDAADVFAYLHEPAVNCFACMKLADMDAAEREVAGRGDDEYYLAVELRENGRVIGEIGGHPESADPEQHNADTLSPCWMLNAAYHGRGYMFEAASAYFDRLFREGGIRRIYAYTEDYNRSCQKLCERLGMRKEGEFLEFVSFVNDERGEPVYENTWQYAILKKEWEKNHP